MLVYVGKVASRWFLFNYILKYVVLHCPTIRRTSLISRTFTVLITVTELFFLSRLRLRVLYTYLTYCISTG